MRTVTWGKALQGMFDAQTLGGSPDRCHPGVALPYKFRQQVGVLTPCKDRRPTLWTTMPPVLSDGMSSS